MMFLNIVILVLTFEQYQNTPYVERNCEDCKRRTYLAQVNFKDIKTHFSNTIVFLNTSDRKGLNKAIHTLRKFGLEIRHVLPPNVVIGYFSGDGKTLRNFQSVKNCLLYTSPSPRD